MPRALPPAGPSPRIAGLLQHVAIAGTVSGVLGAAYQAWLAGHAPDHPVVDNHQTIALATAFHGRRLAEHFVTPAQRALWWALLLPAAASLVLLVAGLVWMGVRTARGARRGGGGGSGRRARDGRG